MPQKDYKQRADGRYLLTWKPPGEDVRGYYGYTVEEAEEKRQKDKARYLLDIPAVRTTSQTFGQYFKAWLDDVKQRVDDGQLHYGTYHTYRSLGENHLLPVLEKIKLQDVTRAHIQRACDRAAKGGLAPRSVKTVHQVAAMVLNAAGPDGDELVPRNPARKVRLPEIEDREPEALTPTEWAAFVAAAKLRRHGDFFIAQGSTGGRTGEWRGMPFTKAHPDGAEPYVEVTGTWTYLPGGSRLTATKRKSSVRTIPLAPEAAAAIRRQLDRLPEMRAVAGLRWRERGLLFPNSRGGVLEYRSLTRRVYALRVTFPTGLAIAGVDAKVRMALMGQKSEVVNQGYTDVLPLMKRDAVQRLARQTETG
jgi:integrase